MPLKMFPANQERPLHPFSKIAHVIAIAAGKGGVGKSTVTVNLALALQLAGYAVGILDADLYGPSMRQMLPEKSLPAQKGENIEPAVSLQGIQMISLAFFRNGNEAVAVRAPIANSLITQFIKNIQWRSLDFLLIDFPPGTGDIQLTLSQQANFTGALLVTTPQEVALMDVRKAANLFEQTKVPLIGVVENMSYYQQTPSDQKVYIFGEGGGRRLSEELGAPFLGQIPIDPELCRHGDAGTSIFKDPSHIGPSAQAFISFAKKFVARSTSLKQMQKEGKGMPDGTSLSIKKISQGERKQLTIEWNDGQLMNIRLNKLQKQCPCANCKEYKQPDPDENVDALKIYTVGRYALRIDYSSGCSAGIYSFEILRAIGEKIEHDL